MPLTGRSSRGTLRTALIKQSKAEQDCRLRALGLGTRSAKESNAPAISLAATFSSMIETLLNRFGHRLHTQRRQQNTPNRNDYVTTNDKFVSPHNEARELDFEPGYAPQKARNPQKSIVSNAAPVVRGISLVSPTELPDRFRPIFPFQLFNAIQSKCFHRIFRTDDNFVLASPTGSGKTAIFELAICRVIAAFASDNFKVIYQAPTKSLCAERQKDWQAKFGPLGAACVEITGDTDQTQMKKVGSASIIVTTPEKWDSMTRKWKDHRKLMQLVRLFLIDEVHIVKESRGATLEAVVSRMKTATENVRFIALSATVPNSQDVAKWLGLDSSHQELPAARETFAEDFRPVKLQKHVIGFTSNGNQFLFDKFLDSKLIDVITKYHRRKPIMVFCPTRKSTEATAALLANWWRDQHPEEHCWPSPQKSVTIEDEELQACLSTGVAFHHAGLVYQDRQTVEKTFLGGDISVVCCTGTLAVGVNLPCHLVIVKGTATYQNSVGRDYSDLEIMQMLGRAGRPQFDDSAIAVIMTRSERVEHYEKMMSGQEVLESCLHLNLIEHLNAEIGLGTIYDMETAITWLRGTFLHVRLQENPSHYRLPGDTTEVLSLNDRLEHILSSNIASLQQNDLVQDGPKLQCSEHGDAMARYYVQFETMKIILGLPPKAKVSEILSAIAQASEFKDLRIRGNERLMYRNLNQSPSTRFPIPVDLALPAHKVSLIIQTVLGSVDIPGRDVQSKIRNQHQIEQAVVFQHVHRLIRCTIDCELSRQDSTGTKNALMLARSLAARVWDDSPLQLKQLERIGVVAVRKLVAAGIRTIEELETADAQRIQTILTKPNPFGLRVLDQARAFPKLRVSVEMHGQPKRKQDGSVMIKLRAEIGFLNETTPVRFNNREVYASAPSRLSKGFEVLFSGSLWNVGQTINCYISCDELAGTMRTASLKPDIPLHLFPSPQDQAASDETELQRHSGVVKPNTSKRLINRSNGSESRPCSKRDEFGDDDIPDLDLIQAAAEKTDFIHIDDLSRRQHASKHIAQTTSSKRRKIEHDRRPERLDESPAVRLENGRWACKHPCKDKTACKHLCCREGLEAPPKISKSQTAGKSSEVSRNQKQNDRQQSIGHSFTKQEASSRATVPGQSRAAVESVDLTGFTSDERRHYPAEQLSKENEKTQKTELDFDPWADIEGDCEMLQDLDDLPEFPPPASSNHPLRPISRNDIDQNTKAMPSRELQRNISQEIDAENPSRKSNLLFVDDTSDPEPVLTEISPQSAAPQQEESCIAQIQAASTSGKRLNAPPAEQSCYATQSPSKSVAKHIVSDDNSKDENEKPDPRLDGVESWLLEEFGDIIELV
ncbi:MAG: Sec63 [Bathelium mastoideum]|nr:MAG: Sec63 [Bathelium mastoideum]